MGWFTGRTGCLKIYDGHLHQINLNLALSGSLLGAGWVDPDKVNMVVKSK